jgi:hypothetical protein
MKLSSVTRLTYPFGGGATTPPPLPGGLVTGGMGLGWLVVGGMGWHPVTVGPVVPWVIGSYETVPYDDANDGDPFDCDPYLATEA